MSFLLLNRTDNKKYVSSSKTTSRAAQDKQNKKTTKLRHA